MNLKRVMEKIMLRVKYAGRFRLSFVGTVLMPQLVPECAPLQYDALNIDINNTCNLRCHFCFNSFEAEHFYMREELFDAIISVFPLVKKVGNGGTGIYLSCLYEPSLHPEFIRFLKKLPKEATEKVFFTTNFSRPWEKEQIREILKANLHHINISIETLDEGRYQEITRSGHYKSFFRNLRNLQEVYEEERGRKPLLRYITMVLRVNQDEILQILHVCSEKFHASEHELRTPYISIYENMDWNREQLLTEEECRKLTWKLSCEKLPLVMDIRPDSGFALAELEAAPAALDLAATEKKTFERKLEEIELCTHEEFLFCRCYASGKYSLNITKETGEIPLHGTAPYFRNLLEKLYRRRADAFSYGKWNPKEQRIKKCHGRVTLESLLENEIDLELRGWFRVNIPVPETENLQLMICMEEPAKRTEEWFLAKEWERLDLKNLPQASAGGFCVHLKKCLLQSPVYRMSLNWCQMQREEVVYRYRYPYGIRVRQLAPKT